MFKRHKHTWNAEKLGHDYTFTIEGVGLTLSAEMYYSRVSSMEELNGYNVVIRYWDEATGRPASYTCGSQEADYTIDATEEVLEKYGQYIYDLEHSKLLREAEEIASHVERGCVAVVVKGRKVPLGTQGKVVGVAASQYGPKVGIATSDEMTEVEKNGRKYMNHKDVVWTAFSNVKRVDVALINMEEIVRRATSASKKKVQEVRDLQNQRKAA